MRLDCHVRCRRYFCSLFPSLLLLLPLPAVWMSHDNSRAPGLMIAAQMYKDDGLTMDDMGTLLREFPRQSARPPAPPAACTGTSYQKRGLGAPHSFRAAGYSLL